MISYGFSIQGKSHVDRGIVCQDAHRIDKLNNGSHIAVIADGVGSAKFSDVGAKVAVESIVEFCKKNISKRTNKSECLHVLKSAYMYALESISTIAEEQRNVIDDYDTTLSVVIYDGKNILYGHAGDGGIVIRRNDGIINLITKPQKGIDGVSVRPLRAGSGSWEFGEITQDIASVLMVTDGILDGVISPFLLNLPEKNGNIGSSEEKNVYITPCELLMNPNFVLKNKKISSPENALVKFIKAELDNNEFNSSIRAGFSKFFDKKLVNQICNSISTYNYVIWAMNKVTDDKTVVVLINDKTKIEVQNVKYYIEPDWKSLQKRFERLAYPELYKDKANDIEDNRDDLDSLNDIKDIDETKNLDKDDRDDSIKKHYHKKRKKIRIFRVIVAVIIALLLLIAMIVGIVCLSSSSDKSDESNSKTTEFKTDTSEVTSNEIETSTSESETEELSTTEESEVDTDKII